MESLLLSHLPTTPICPYRISGIGLSMLRALSFSIILTQILVRDGLFERLFLIESVHYHLFV